MRPEDVPQYARLAAIDALVKAGPGADTTGVILSAVIPAIRADALERAAVVVEGLEVHSTSRRSPGVTRKIKVGPAVAAAIRAMKEEGT